MSNNNYSSQDALTKLRQRLLDLSNKNLFLNHKNPANSKHCACFVNFDAHPVIDELLKGASISLAGIPAPTLSPLGPSHSKESWLTDQFKSFSLESSDVYSKSNNLLSFEFDTDLEKKLLKLQKKAKQAVEETGANSLYLSFGFLEYVSEKEPGTTLLAPLINIPVEIAQKDVLSPYTVTYTGAPLLENFSIKERLKQELGLTLGDFPDFSDADDWAYKAYFDEIEAALVSKGWKIKQYLSLNNLPPLNMILFHDLREENWIKQGKNLLEIPSISEILDKNVHDKENSQVYSYDIDSIDTSLPDYPLLIEEADSSQLNAVLNILNSNENQVIIGPPGTGKSQTITNIIASLMYKGKKVLFISEKLAALDVVKQRLARSGLAPFVMPLHNNKIAKKEIVQSLSDAMDVLASEELVPDKSNYELLRQGLARYCYDLNATDNSKKISVFDSIWDTNYLKLFKDTSQSFSKTTIEQFFENKAEMDQVLHTLNNSLIDLKQVGPDHCLWKLKYSKNEMFDFSGFSKEFYDFVQIFKQTKEIIHNKNIPQAIEYAKFLKEVAYFLSSIKMPAENNKLSVHQYLLFKDKDNKALLDQFSNCKDKLENVLSAIDALIKKNDLSLNFFDEKFLVEKINSIPAVLAPKKRLDLNLEKIAYLINLSYSDLQSCVWEKVSASELELNLFSNEENVDLVYLGDALTLKQNQSSINKIIELKQQITLLENSSPLKFPTDQESLDEVLDATNFLVEKSDSILKYLSKDWYSSLRIHKKYQKDILKKFSLKDKELNLLGLVAIYNLYLSLSQEIQKLKKCPALVEEDVFFDLDELQKSLEFSYRWDDLSRNVLNVPINGNVQALKKFCQTGLKLISAYANIGWGAAIENEHEFNRRQAILKELLRSYSQKNIPDKIGFWEFIYLAYLTQVKNELYLELEAKEFSEISLSDSNYQTRRDTAKIIENIHSLPGGRWVYELCVSGEVTDNLENLPEVVRDISNELQALLGQISVKIKQLQNKFDVSFEFEGYPVKIDVSDFDLIEKIFESIHLVPGWIQYTNSLKKIDRILPEFSQKMRALTVTSAGLDVLYDSLKKQAYFEFSEAMITSNPVLIQSVGAQEDNQDKFSQIDSEILRNNRVYLKNSLIQNRSLPKGESGARVKDYTEMVLLKHLKKTPGARVSIRELFSKAGKSIQELKPCFLMGPQAVAQYLAPSEFSFDVLIIDEGSQMRLEHALGAIARSAQIVVVGDPEQLGPSNSFYGMHKEDDKWAILESESVLTWAAAKYKESSLTWHYRSKHQSLIDFSNKTFYSNRLTVVPSAELKSDSLGLNYHYLEHSNYANSVNMAEVDVIVEKAVSFMKSNPNNSMGIVALNMYQAEAIEKELDVVALTNPLVLDYIKKWEELNEEFFVKNLENVQGDERDIMLVSLTFGKNVTTGVLGQNFGLISREDGGRRLNVLVTRAKKSMHVFSSMKAIEIKEEPKTPRGTVILKRFLEYCESSGRNGVPDSVHDPESPFEKAICSLLDKQGYKYTCQLGVSGYRIDIAVKNPYQNSYLVAIECDGASYHSAKSVKDRDKLRQSVLEDRGWAGKIYRIWSTDWFKDPKEEAEKLMEFIAKAEIDFAS